MPEKTTETPQKAQSRLELIEDRISAVETEVLNLLEWKGQAEKAGFGKPKGLFGGKRERVAMKDTTNGTVYVSKSALGKALATEADTTPEDHFAYYKLMSKFPDRFVQASEVEKAKAEKEEEERLAAEIAAAEATG